MQSEQENYVRKGLDSTQENIWEKNGTRADVKWMLEYYVFWILHTKPLALNVGIQKMSAEAVTFHPIKVKIKSWSWASIMPAQAWVQDLEGATAILVTLTVLHLASAIGTWLNILVVAFGRMHCGTKE